VRDIHTASFARPVSCGAGGSSSFAFAKICEDDCDIVGVAFVGVVMRQQSTDLGTEVVSEEVRLRKVLCRETRGQASTGKSAGEARVAVERAFLNIVLA
jgi:hypothetical protein